MAFKHRVKQLEDLEESLRPHYKLGDDGHFHAEIEDDGKVTTYTAKARSSAGLLTDLTRFKNELGELRQVVGDRTPQALQALLASGASVDERIQGALKEVREKEVTPLKTQNESLLRELTVERLDKTIDEALDAAGVEPERKRAARVVAKQHVKLDPADNKTVRVYDENGVASVYDPKTWLGTTFKEQNGFYFKGTAAGGTMGDGPTPGTQRPATPPPGSKTTPTTPTKPGAAPADGEKPRVNKNDQKAYLANVDKIAKGEVELVDEPV